MRSERGPQCSRLYFSICGLRVSDAAGTRLTPEVRLQNCVIELRELVEVGSLGCARTGLSPFGAGGGYLLDKGGATCSGCICGRGKCSEPILQSGENGGGVSAHSAAVTIAAVGQDVSGCQFHGSNVRSSWLLVLPETIRCRTSVR